MDVVATAGHVDHGKSTLVRALTGMEPDRWAEERRRGLTIDLGFAWTELPSGRTVAVVDVPGHERFIGNMLAGIGSVPAALLVVPLGLTLGLLIGAGAGYVVQDVRGKGGSDRLKGAAIGAVGGALCDDVRLCQ